MEEIDIPEQDHTLACIIRSMLFENGATFAACVMPHPLDTSLKVIVSHPESAKVCLLDALRDAMGEVEQCSRAAKSRQIYEKMVTE